MLGEAEIIIGGLSFEKVDGVRRLKSVFILDTDGETSMEVPVLDDENIDKEKLAKILLENYRKEVIVILDLSNDIGRPDSRYIKLEFVGIRK